VGGGGGKGAAKRPPSLLYFQQFGIVLLNLFIQFFIVILIVSLHEIIVAEAHHSFEIHVIQHLLNKLILKLFTVSHFLRGEL
jgi:hypothetical protein